MKKIFIFIMVMSIVIAATSAVFAGSERLRVPRIAYLEPNNDSVVDLTGKNSLTFKWKSQPVPSGGRHALRFRLFKGFGYDVLVALELERDVFSVEVPVDKFEDGALYSWHVQQRDASNMLWSLYDTWSFKVIKGGKK